MQGKLMKMIGKKRDLSENEKNAKIGVMKELADEASAAMHGKISHLKHLSDATQGLKKVSVMSDSPEGLSQGLDTAKDMMMSKGGKVMSDSEYDEAKEDAEEPYSDVESAHDEHESDEGHEESESPEVEMAEQSDDDEDEHMSEDEINQKLEKLMKLKEKMAKK